MRHKFDRWQVSLMAVIMLMLGIMLGMSLGGAAYAWSPPSGENVVLDNARSVRGKDTGGTEQNLLTLYSNTCLNTPAGKAILFTVNNAEKARLTYTGSMVLPNGVSYSAKNSGGTVQNLLTLWNNTCLNAPSGKDILFTVNNGEKARLTSTGNVGIGDSTPTEGKLVVRTTSGEAIYGDTSDAYGYGVRGVSPHCGVWGYSYNGIGVFGQCTGASGNAGSFDGKVKISGSLATKYESVTTSTTLDGKDSIIAVDGSAAVTITLPFNDGGFAGRTYTIINVDATDNDVIVDGYGAELINGNSNYTLASQYNYVTVVSTGSNWLIVANGP